MTAAFIAPNFDGIAAELRRLPRWLTWRALQRPGKLKPDKVPYSPTLPDSFASSTDPGTWGIFEPAEAAYLDGDRTGVGLVLDGTGDLAGVDFDGCRDAATGTVDPAALALLEGMGGADVEVSPSGTGLRAFGYAPPLETGCAGKLDGLKLELYSKGRYLTLTGAAIKAGPLVPLRGFGELAERIRAGRKVNPETGEIDRSAPDEHHAELVRRIMSGDVFHDSLRDLAASLGATDMQASAVVNHLRGLMDASAAPHDGRWHSRRAQTPELVSSAAAKYAPPALAWCVRGVLPAVGLAVFFGPSTLGKRFLGFDLAAAIAGGWRWFDYRVTATPVVCATLEGEAGFKLRAQAWEVHRGQRLPDGLRMMLQPFRLTEPRDIADQAAVVPVGAVVFLDILNRAAPTADENSSMDMGEILGAAKRLQAATGGLLVLVHHTGKDSTRGLHGHSSLFAAMHAAVDVSRDGDRREWKVSKSKDAQDGATHPFGLEVLTLGTDEHADTITSCVVTAGEVSASRTPRLTPAQRMARDSLVAACEQSGELDDAGNPGGVHVDDWREVFYAASTVDNVPAKKVAFQRARSVLCSENLATVEADFYRPTDPALHFLIMRAISNQPAERNTNGTCSWRCRNGTEHNTRKCSDCSACFAC